MIYIGGLEHRCDHDLRLKDHEPILLATLPIKRCLNALVHEPGRQRRTVVRSENVMIHAQVAKHLSGQHAICRRLAISDATQIVEDSVAVPQPGTTGDKCFSIDKADASVLKPSNICGDGHQLHDATTLRITLCRCIAGG